MSTLLATFVHIPSLSSVPGGVVFTNEQRQVLLRYFDEYGMTSTHRRNTDIIQRCADEVGTSVERVKVRGGGVACRVPRPVNSRRVI